MLNVLWSYRENFAEHMCWELLSWNMALMWTTPVAHSLRSHLVEVGTTVSLVILQGVGDVQPQHRAGSHCLCEWGPRPAGLPRWMVGWGLRASEFSHRAPRCFCHCQEGFIICLFTVMQKGSWVIKDGGLQVRAFIWKEKGSYVKKCSSCSQTVWVWTRWLWGFWFWVIPRGEIVLKDPPNS